MSLALILARTLSTGSTSFRHRASDEFQVFNEVGRCENDIDQHVKGNEAIIADCVKKHLSASMSDEQKNKIVSEMLNPNQHWSGAFKCKNHKKTAHAVCFNVVQGDKLLPGEVMFRPEPGGLKIVAIKTEQ